MTVLRQGIVFDIEHYAVHDGPGIRTVVFLKGCPLSCLWCCNPESQHPAPELRHTALRCRDCLECEKACRRHAIRPASPLPVFHRDACSVCAAPCVEACPQGALAVAGEATTADRVMARVAADKAFYDNSDGGVTFSGGEPFAQPAFLEELLDRSQQLGIHTVVETCGHADPGAVARCEPMVNLFLYDLKVMDSGRHRRLTGVSNSVILQNLRTLAEKAPGKVRVRVPVVPGCTDDARNLVAIAQFLTSLGISRAELMPYHTLGIEKYQSLGRDYALTGSQSVTECELEDAGRLFRDNGVACHNPATAVDCQRGQHA